MIISMVEILTGRALERAANDLSAVGRRLIAARLAARLTPKDLCRRAGISSSTLSNWETGANRPRVDQLGRVLPILNVTSDFIFYGVDGALSWEVRERIAQALRQLATSEAAGAPDATSKPEAQKNPAFRKSG